MSTNYLNEGTIESASRGNYNALRNVLLQVKANFDQNNTATGQAPLQKIDKTPVATAPKPGTAGFQVTASGGTVTVAITNPQNYTPASPKLYLSQAANTPNLQNAPIYHELSSSPDPTFQSDVTTYPASVQLHYQFNLPGQTAYWRLRSSYDQQNWNTYQTFTDPGLVVPVAAGLGISSSTNPNIPLNQSNYANVDSVAAGGSATVRVYNAISGPNKSWVRVLGPNSSVLPSANVLNVPFSTNPFVAYDGDKFQVLPQLPQTFNDEWLPVGRVSVVGSGPVVLPVITPVITGGHLVGLSYTPGSGMTQPPVLTVADPGGPGTGATVTAVVSGGQMTGYNIGNAGDNYDGATTVTASGGVFAGAGGGGGPTGFNGGRIYVPQSS